MLEQSGSLLKKRLRPYFASNRQADVLTFKDVFRHAAKHGLISVDACERWCVYRDNRNDTAHDYGREVRGDDAEVACRTSSRTPGNWQVS